MDTSLHISHLENQLNHFIPATRRQALEELNRLAIEGNITSASEQNSVNMHCHTFFSFNAYGYSPSGLAWLAKQRGYWGVGIVDFDVLDGVDEFLSACTLLGVRGSAGLESRVFIPEYSTCEINSPGEPGVFYDMGIGFTSSHAQGEAGLLLNDLGNRARQRNLAMVNRLNQYLAPVMVDYEHDVLPLTPGGTATERHIVAAYIQSAEKNGNVVNFWAEKTNSTPEQIQKLEVDSAGFQNFLRSKLMKKGGAGYANPGPELFPNIGSFHEMIVKCGAIPCHTWLDGISQGEKEMEALLDLTINKGTEALNIIPDRNWNITDPELKRIKLQNLYRVVTLAKERDLPLNIGTEMNSFGQKHIDDFLAQELEPVRQAFLDGASFIYGHTMLERSKALGYQSAWSKKNLPSRKLRNQFYTEAGYRIKPGELGIEKLKLINPKLTPDQILTALI